MSELRLETERLILGLPAADDTEALLDYATRNDAFHAPWSPPRPPGALTIENTLKRIRAMHTELGDRKNVRFWFRLRGAERGPFIGAAQLSGIQLGPFRACYLGYHLDQQAVGKGYMIEALTAIIRYAFDELKLHRIMANYMPHNERSARVLQRLGFVVEGYAREYLFIDGAFRDHVLTSLTNANLADAARLCMSAE